MLKLLMEVDKMRAKLLKYKWYLAITGLIILNMARYGYHNYVLDKEMTIHSTEVYAPNRIERNEKVALKEQNNEESEEEVKNVEINTEKEATSLKKIPIYICGAVKNPGVYYIAENSIVEDVVKLSGGLTPEADLMVINLAEAVHENCKIIIPKLEEEIDNSSNLYENNKEIVKQESNQAQKIININTATKEELMSLNGIGSAKADAILNYRTENTTFQSIEDIKNVSGIGDKTFENIRSFITV